MSSVQSLREFISERLTAAAEEIFTEFEKTIVRYEEEIDRQRRLVDISWRPEITSVRTEFPHHSVWKEKEVLTDQQLCDQERSSSLDQEEPEPLQVKDEEGEPDPLQIKEEQEEFCISQGEEELVQKQEADTFIVTPTYEERYHWEPEPNWDHPLNQDFPETENQNQEGSRNKDSLSNRDEELEPNQRSSQTRHHIDDIGGPKPKRHKNPHTSEKPYSCEICGKCFTQSSNLNVHMRTHSDVKSFLCQTCGSRFTQKSYLINHMRTHTGEKPYSCEICCKCFSRNSHLTEHRRTHTGEKPYSCHTCGKSFIQKGHLRSHMGTHTGEKPFSCHTCGKSFIQNGHLRYHMRTQHM